MGVVASPLLTSKILKSSRCKENELNMYNYVQIPMPKDMYVSTQNIRANTIQKLETYKRMYASLRKHTLHSYFHVYNIIQRHEHIGYESIHTGFSICIIQIIV